MRLPRHMRCFNIIKLYLNLCCPGGLGNGRAGCRSSFHATSAGAHLKKMSRPRRTHLAADLRRGPKTISSSFTKSNHLSLRTPESSIKCISRCKRIWFGISRSWCCHFCRNFYFPKSVRSFVAAWSWGGWRALGTFLHRFMCKNCQFLQCAKSSYFVSVTKWSGYFVRNTPVESPNSAQTTNRRSTNASPRCAKLVKHLEQTLLSFQTPFS